MGSGQLLTLRSLAQLPAEPSAGREASNIWRTFLREPLQKGLREGRGALVRTSGREGACSPGHLTLFSAPSFAAPSPQAPSLTPKPSGPARLRPGEPPSLAASPRQRAPSICRKTPPFFNAPGASPSFREPPDSNLVNEESGPASPRS